MNINLAPPLRDCLFISYRRDDARGTSGRPYDWLRIAFGRERVFRDVTSIGVGPWRREIDAALARSIACLAVIGPRWANADNLPRLHESSDMVRHELTQALAARDPDNAGWQRHLSVSFEKIGDLLRDQGNVSGALAAFRRALDIRETLATRDADNAQWQTDFVVSYAKLAPRLSVARASDPAATARGGPAAGCLGLARTARAGVATVAAGRLMRARQPVTVTAQRLASATPYQSADSRAALPAADRYRT